jgi:hypothetical protein
MRTLPLLSWPGGKSRHLKRILPHIPASAGYIEAFAGGCAVLLAKPKSRLEVVNDVNGDLVNLYRVAANHPDELVRKFLELPGSREQIKHSRELLKTSGCLTDVQRAALFLHLNKRSFGGSGTTLAIARNPASSAFMDNAKIIERIHAFQRRSLWQGHDVVCLQTRNGSGNQAIGPTRYFGELIIYSPGLRL